MAAAQGRLDAAIYATPALADPDRDGKLDVVFGAADQHIYAVKGNGRLVPGWPVLAKSHSASATPYSTHSCAASRPRCLNSPLSVQGR